MGEDGPVTEPARSRRPRGSIDAEQILEGAFRLAAEVGLAKLSMTELAARLNVGVTSIYWHVANKDELLRRMATQAIQRLDEQLPRPAAREPAGWRAYLEEYFGRQREVFAADDLLTDLTAVQQSSSDARGTDLAYGSLEAIVQYLVSAGFRPVDAWNLYSSLAAFTQGFVLSERRRMISGFPPAGLRQLGVIDPERTPLLTELVRDEGILIDMTGDGVFAYGLARMLDGAERASTR